VFAITSMVDVLALLCRDHTELERVLQVMIAPASPEAELREALEAVHVGLSAHAEAEGVMLRAMLDRSHPPALVYLLCSQVVAAHLAQEGALVSLEASRPGTQQWRDRAAHLRNLIDHHDLHERSCVLPALRDYLPRDIYQRLASSYASARLRALGTVPIPVIVREDSRRVVYD
jgi:hypothetical protein